MKNEVLYDITTHDLNGLKDHFNITEDEIFGFYRKSSKMADAENFVKYFNISNKRILEKDLSITSLHVTTVNDQLESMKKYGLVNLQKALSFETPLKHYLLAKGVSIDVERKTILHKDKTIDVSEKYNGNLDDPIQWIIYKLFIDYPLTSFFTTNDATEYLGRVHERPEFLKNLAKLLDSPDINNDWINNNECYVIKFRSELDSFSEMSFGMSSSESAKSEPEIELQKRMWIIDKALENQRYGYEDTCFSYMKGHVCIPYSDFLSIYTLDDYKQEYKVK